MFDVVVLGEQVRKAASADVSLLSEDEVCEAARFIAEVEPMLAAFKAHVLAELERRGTTDRRWGLSTAMWWARQAGTSVSSASTDVRVARRLDEQFGRVDEALTAGEMTWEQARVLDRACNPRVVEHVAAVQDEIVDLARGALFETWRTDVRNLVSQVDQDGGHDPRGDEARSHLTVASTIDGVTHVAGTLAGEDGEVARQAIETVADELFHRHAVDAEHSPDLPSPTRGQLRALALAELCRRGLAADLHSTIAPRPDITVVVHADEPDRAATADGVLLSDGTTRRLWCDADLTPIVVDRLGVPLDMGRKVRLATPAQRRALVVRDRGCTFPGCGAAPNWCAVHHVHEFQHGGSTDLENLALLCGRHHSVTHRLGWLMHPSGNGCFTWTTPSGETLHSQRHRRAAPAHEDQPP